MEEVRGGRNAKRGRRGTGWRRSRRARSVQVVAGIPDQYFHRFSGGYRQVASSLALSNPYPSPILWRRYLSPFPPSLILPRLVHSRCPRFAFFSLPLWSSRSTFFPPSFCALLSSCFLLRSFAHPSCSLRLLFILLTSYFYIFFG